MNDVNKGERIQVMCSHHTLVSCCVTCFTETTCFLLFASGPSQTSQPEVHTCYV